MIRRFSVSMLVLFCFTIIPYLIGTYINIQIKDDILNGWMGRWAVGIGTQVLLLTVGWLVYLWLRWVIKGD